MLLHETIKSLKQDVAPANPWAYRALWVTLGKSQPLLSEIYTKSIANVLGLPEGMWNAHDIFDAVRGHHVPMPPFLKQGKMGGR